MWLVLILSLFGRLSEGVVLPVSRTYHVNPLLGSPIGLRGHGHGHGHGHGLAGSPLGLAGSPLGLAGSPLGLAGSPLGMATSPLGLRGPHLGLRSRGIHNPLGGGGMVASIFDDLLGGSSRDIHDHHLVDGPIGGVGGAAEAEGLDHGHVGDNCQHRNFGCDVPGYHCVQTSEQGYTLCTDGLAAHCHCKRGCMHKGFFIQNQYRRAFNVDCQMCECRAGQVGGGSLKCYRSRRRQCRRGRRRRYRFSRFNRW